jgi:hypothetical protein
LPRVTELPNGFFAESARLNAQHFTRRSHSPYVGIIRIIGIVAGKVRIRQHIEPFFVVGFQVDGELPSCVFDGIVEHLKRLLTSHRIQPAADTQSPNRELEILAVTLRIHPCTLMLLVAADTRTLSQPDTLALFVS